MNIPYLLKHSIFFVIIIVYSIFSFTQLPGRQNDRADRYWNEAMRFKKQKKFSKAVQKMKMAVIVERKKKNPRKNELINELNEIGSLYLIIGNYEKSLHYYKLMLKVTRKYVDSINRVKALSGIAGAYFKLKRYDEALQTYQRALVESRKLPIQDRTLKILDRIAHVYRDTYDFSQALKYYQQALAIINNTQALLENASAIFSNIGTMYYFKGDYEKSRHYYNRALDIDQRNNRHKYLSSDLSNIGSLYMVLGKFGEALNYFEEALKIDRARGNRINIAARLYSIGELYRNLGDGIKAMSYYKRSMKINEELNHTINIAYIFNSIGKTYEASGMLDHALENYIKALRINKELGSQENILLRLEDIGLLYEQRDRFLLASAYLKKALMNNILNDKERRVARNLTSIGRVMISLGQYSRADQYFIQSLAIYSKLNDYMSQALDLKNRGIAAFYRKKYIAAERFFKNARETLSHFSGKNLFKYHTILSGIYRWLISSMIKNKKADEALLAVENYSTSKLDFMKVESIEQNHHKVDALRKTKEMLNSSEAIVVFSNMRWDNPIQIYLDKDRTIGSIIEKGKMVKILIKKYQGFLKQYTANHVQTPVFSYRESSRKDYYSLEFQKLIKLYRLLLSKQYITSKEKKVLTGLGRSLYKLLLENIESYISSKKELIIKPGGSLSLIPFETLIMPDGRYLVEKYAISYAITTNRTINHEPDNTKAFNFITTGPSINIFQSKRVKIQSIRHYNHLVDLLYKNINEKLKINAFYKYFFSSNVQFKNTANLSFNFFRNAFSGQLLRIKHYTLNECDIVDLCKKNNNAIRGITFLSANALIIPDLPELSSIAFATGKKLNDGILNLKEISRLCLPASLVTIGDVIIPDATFLRNEAIWYLINSFYKAGSSSVSLPLWRIDNKVKKLFYSNIYNKILINRMPMVRAFNETKREFISGKITEKEISSDTPHHGMTEGKIFANPYFWASVVLYKK